MAEPILIHLLSELLKNILGTHLNFLHELFKGKRTKKLSLRKRKKFWRWKTIILHLENTNINIYVHNAYIRMNLSKNCIGYYWCLRNRNFCKVNVSTKPMPHLEKVFLLQGVPVLVILLYLGQFHGPSLLLSCNSFVLNDIVYITLNNKI